MSDRQAILFANTAFYAAFATRDLDAMEKVWAKDRQVSCIHPGWQPLTGRAKVMGSWRSILSNPQAPRISCRAENATVFGDVAVVTCIEQLPGAQGAATQFLTATNVFVRAGSVWAMVHHQAGPVNLDPAALADEDEKPAVN